MRLLDLTFLFVSEEDWYIRLYYKLSVLYKHTANATIFQNINYCESSLSFSDRNTLRGYQSNGNKGNFERTTLILIYRKIFFNKTNNINKIAARFC